MHKSIEEQLKENTFQFQGLTFDLTVSRTQPKKLTNNDENELCRSNDFLAFLKAMDEAGMF